MQPESPRPPAPADPAAVVAAALAAGGVRAALATLNALTPFRYSAMYRFDDTLLRNLHFYDRLDPNADPGDDLPITATYCVYVQQTGRPFVLADALEDIRADGHPKQQVIRAYCGVGLADAAGRTIGSLCHFDHDPVPDAEAVVALTETLAPLLTARAVGPGGPAIS